MLNNINSFIKFLLFNLTRFDYEVTDKGESDNDRSICELTIHNLTSDERGEWLCSLRDEIQIANGTEFLSDETEKLTVNVFQKIGSSFDVSIKLMNFLINFHYHKNQFFFFF